MVGTLNYTTSVPVDKTLHEITTMLGRHGAEQVATRWVDGAPIGVSFTLITPAGRQAYALPVDVDAMAASLTEQAKRKRIDRRYATPEQAARTAWRVIKDWLAAQLALVAAAMTSLDAVMLPYLLVDETTTLYVAWRDNAGVARAIAGATS